jgi:hypothetical protein
LYQRSLRLSPAPRVRRRPRRTPPAATVIIITASYIRNRCVRYVPKCTCGARAGPSRLSFSCSSARCGLDDVLRCACAVCAQAATGKAPCYVRDCVLIKER